MVQQLVLPIKDTNVLKAAQDTPSETWKYSKEPEPLLALVLLALN